MESTLQAYAHGAFPMAENGELGYFECDPRSVYTFESFHVSKRLKRIYKKNPFQMKIDTAFPQVIRACREGRPEWISMELVEIYECLFEQGFMHSFEAWEGDALVGGCYGASIGAAFMAESMFHTRDNASNICVVYMMECLENSGYHFCDVQYANDHTRRFHPESWSKSKFQERLKLALNHQIHLESV